MRKRCAGGRLLLALALVAVTAHVATAMEPLARERMRATVGGACGFDSTRVTGSTCMMVEPSCIPSDDQCRGAVRLQLLDAETGLVIEPWFIFKGTTLELTGDCIVQVPPTATYAKFLTYEYMGTCIPGQPNDDCVRTEVKCAVVTLYNNAACTEVFEQEAFVYTDGCYASEGAGMAGLEALKRSH